MERRWFKSLLTSSLLNGETRAASSKTRRGDRLVRKTWGRRGEGLGEGARYQQPDRHCELGARRERHLVMGAHPPDDGAAEYPAASWWWRPPAACQTAVSALLYPLNEVVDEHYSVYWDLS